MREICARCTGEDELRSGMSVRSTEGLERERGEREGTAGKRGEAGKAARSALTSLPTRCNEGFDAGGSRKFIMRPVFVSSLFSSLPSSSFFVPVLSLLLHLFLFVTFSLKIFFVESLFFCRSSRIV